MTSSPTQGIPDKVRGAAVNLQEALQLWPKDWEKLPEKKRKWLTEIGWALTLAASAHAYGADLGLAQALVVNMCASVFASIMPVPGGIGVAEASLAAGMMAFGVPSSEAYAAALTHRLATFYLPPIWGWFSLRYLTRKGYL